MWLKGVYRTCIGVEVLQMHETRASVCYKESKREEVWIIENNAAGTKEILQGRELPHNKTSKMAVPSQNTISSAFRL
jgi:hypothetical protein